MPRLLSEAPIAIILVQDPHDLVLSLLEHKLTAWSEEEEKTPCPLGNPKLNHRCVGAVITTVHAKVGEWTHENTSTGLQISGDGAFVTGDKIDKFIREYSGMLKTAGSSGRGKARLFKTFGSFLTGIDWTENPRSSACVEKKVSAAAASGSNRSSATTPNATIAGSRIQRAQDLHWSRCQGNIKEGRLIFYF